jgi:hypothetical protein
MAFPTLSVNPNYPIEESIESSSIKSKFEAGYVLTRARFTRQRNIFKLSYSLLSNADKILLKAHMDTVLDISTFDWTHPVSSVTYSVRYQSIPQFQYMQYQRWSVSFILEQI